LKFKHALIASALSLFFSFIALQQLPLGISHISVDKSDANIEFPYSFKGKSNQIYHYKATLSTSALSSKYLKIVPDDCLESLSINYADIPITHLKGRCSWQHGFSIDLSKYLDKKENTISLHVKNKDGVGGLNLIALQDYDSLSYRIISSIMILSLLILVTLILLYMEFSWEIIILLVAGLFLRIAYMSYTDFDERTYDVVLNSGHLDYIKMIANDFMLPNPTEGWEYHQPPLYYATAAFFYKIASFTGLADKFVTLQLLSLAQYFIFLIYSIKILSLTLKSKSIIFFAALLIIFWPSGIIHSIRIGNDILFYMLFVLSIYYMILWQRFQKALWITVLFASLALITKSNGIILFGIIGSILLLNLISKKQYRLFFKDSFLVLLFFSIAFGINFIDNIYYAMQGEGKDWLVSNVINTLNKKLFVSNIFENYIYFDFKTYIIEPYIDAWHDQYGRQYFWNYLFKSSLFAEFFFKLPYQELIASLISALSLGIFFYIFIAIATLKKEQLLEATIFLLILGFSIIALLAYRIKIPVSCNTDFRYILPVIISMGYFYALSLQWSREKGLIIIEYFGYFQILFFTLLSSIFFIIPLMY
jgi:hypothetical protein